METKVEKTNMDTQTKRVAKNWIDTEELKAQIMLARETGACSERLGALFVKITGIALNHANFKHYPEAMKQDMASAAYAKLLKMPAHFKDNFKAYSSYNYCKLIIWREFFGVIMREYKQRNIRRALAKKIVEENPMLDDIGRQRLLDFVLRGDTSLPEGKESEI